MKALIISTVGISLLSNFARSKGIKNIDVGSLDVEQILKFISQDPSSASAETNSILKIIDELNREGIMSKDIISVLLVSETDEGKFCARALKRYFETNMAIYTLVIEIEGLKYDEKRFIYTGLKKLVEEVIMIVRGHKGKRIILNATGGFKAEIAYLSVIGAILGLEVYYIHEKFRSIVKLPKLPISIDKEKLEEFLRITNLLQSKIKIEEVNKKAEELGVSPETIIMGTILYEENGEYFLEPSPLYLLLKDLLDL